MKLILKIHILFFILWGILLPVKVLQASEKIILDEFEKITNWSVFSSKEATLNLEWDKGFIHKGLKLNFDLGEKGSAVVISKDVSYTLPKNYRFIFYIKGGGAENNIEFKLVDALGNTYKKRIENFSFSGEWQKMAVDAEDIIFSTRPTQKERPEKIKKIEFEISRDQGGKGYVIIDELYLVESDEQALDKPWIKVMVSSTEEEPRLGAQNLLDKNRETRWSSQFSDPQWIQIDLGSIQDIYGLVLYWEAAYAKEYCIQLSLENTNWHDVYSIKDSDGGSDDIYFGRHEARYIKIIGTKRATTWGYSLWEIVLKGPKDKIIFSVSSSDKTNIPEKAMDGNLNTKWYSGKYKSAKFEINFIKIKELGGLFIYWDENYAKSYSIQGSTDGKKYRTIYRVSHGNGCTDKIYLEKISLKYLRINCRNGSGYGIKEILIKGPDEAVTPERLYEARAEESPKGYYPRWLSQEQVYWNVVGVENDEKEALLSEDGDIEPEKNGFSISPFLYTKGKLITREQVKITQSLQDDYLPISRVKWEYKNFTMNITVFAYGEPEDSVIGALYKITNTGNSIVKGKLYLTIRPFQVNPPWQFGGISKITEIKNQKGIISINGMDKLFSQTKMSRFGAINYLDGDIIDFIANGGVPENQSIKDSSGGISAVMEYNFYLNPGMYKYVYIELPLHDKKSLPEGNEIIKLSNAIQSWEEKLNQVEINIPNKDLINTLKANLGYLFIHRDGVSIQPGSRNYDRAWIRDGAIMGVALLKMGYPNEVKNFINWFSSFQLANGKVPAVINKNTVDSIEEYDSQGELIYLITQYYFYTGDRNFLESKFTNIINSLKFLVELRNRRTTSEYLVPEKRKFYGILPESISHEGYMPAMHSYWDDFWALKGWKDAIDVARILGKTDVIPWMKEQEEALRKSVYESMKLVINEKKIDYIPGCAEKGDFDPTSTAMAVMVCDQLENLPQPHLNNTFNKYFTDVQARLQPDWFGSYTPYEVRSVQAYIYLDQKERAHALLSFLMRDRRPLEWKHFAEVMHYPYRLGQYIGDMPHSWIGAEFINAIRSMFVYEKGNSLIVGAGIIEDWLKEGQEISVKELPTELGTVTYTIKKNNNQINMHISGNIKPNSKIIIKSPFSQNIQKVIINDIESDKFNSKEVFIDQLPADIKIVY